MSIREVIADVRKSLDSQTLDNHISSEAIWFKLVYFSSLLLKRESDQRKLFNNTSAFTKFKVEMEDSGSGMKSQKPIPRAFLSSLGSLIQISNQDKSKNFKETTATAYALQAKQEFKSRATKYFYLEDSYLYIPDSDIAEVQVLGLFSDVLELYLYLYGEECFNLLDQRAPILDYHLSTVIQQTVQSLLPSLEIRRDENSNLNENN